MVQVSRNVRSACEPSINSTIFCHVSLVRSTFLLPGLSNLVRWPLTRSEGVKSLPRVFSVLENQVRIVSIV
jgi:hypothetical protein